MDFYVFILYIIYHHNINVVISTLVFAHFTRRVGMAAHLSFISRQSWSDMGWSMTMNMLVFPNRHCQYESGASRYNVGTR